METASFLLRGLVPWALLLLVTFGTFSTAFNWPRRTRRGWRREFYYALARCGILRPDAEGEPEIKWPFFQSARPPGRLPLPKR